MVEIFQIILLYVRSYAEMYIHTYIRYNNQMKYVYVRVVLTFYLFIFRLFFDYFMTNAF